VGEFAFLLFEFIDNNLAQLVCGRDQVGVRPLYYSGSNQYLMFSSEIKGMEYGKNSPKEYNPGTITSFKLIDNEFVF
jgi:asparagine synthetase B (glutamine-hydrolysing)